MIYSEGKVTIEVPDSEKLLKKNEVFLNENKKLDRDLHVILINSLDWKAKSFLDLMAASGIRAIRLAKETKSFNRIVMNDIKKTAYDNMKLNAERNKIKAEFYNKSSQDLFCELRESFDNIDVDPFGSPVYFIRDAVQHVEKEGILSITSTDTGCLSGSFPTACARRYHSKSYLSEFYYESGLRILAKSAIEEASIYDTALVPIFSHAIGHYFRIYFKKIRGAKQTDNLLKNIQSISYCPYCLHREIGSAKICPNCKKNTTIIGPLFTGKIFDDKLLTNMISQNSEYTELLKRMQEENKIDIPWHYTTDRVSRVYKLTEPPITKLPYARTHINAKGFKTKDSIKEIVEKFKKLQ
ncbi:tRNA (guanine(26)-N(2))-dimethyltransferase [Candidatus Tiddalikarchaeum anstoanum]|nr:tRNA (guanine(26)-N(2))-dimethyltransferase [Candidatus Tiddalikarchaeum anstoanum]